ncbi:MAG: hypothetical protein Q8M76_06125, partial [Spirochaetaceae bacterium]|nr:hypothetical protein [Spirochaetaceae bacterium]
MSEKAKTTVRTLVIALVVVAAFSSCGGLLQGGGTSGIAIRIVDARARTLTPANSMEPAEYEISCSRAGRETPVVGTFAADGSVATIYLEPGTWDVALSAFNAEGTPIGGGSTTGVVVTAGDVSAVSIAVSPLTGNGSFNLTIDYTAISSVIADFSATPTLGGELILAGEETGTAFSVALPEGFTSASYENSAVPAGYYELHLKLYDGAVQRAQAAPESVRIVANLTTEGTVEFTSSGSAIEMTIETDLLDPITFTFTGFSAQLLQGDSMTVSATAVGTNDEITWEWYLDGVRSSGSPFSTSSSAPIPGDLILGRHRLDLFAKTIDKAGSTSLFFIVASSLKPADPGSYTVTNLASLQALAGKTEIGGNLTISDPDGEITDLDALSSLVSIGGNLSIQSMPALADLHNLDAEPPHPGLAALESVGGWIRINSNIQLSSANLPSLVEIGTGIQVNSNPMLETLVCGLTGTGSDENGLPDGKLPQIEIQSNPFLTLIDFGTAVNRFASSVYIYNNGATGA